MLNVSASDYRSQGYGANKYAAGEANASMGVWQTEYPELTFRYERKFNQYDEPIRRMGGETLTGYYTHHVYANTDTVGAYLITRAKVYTREYYRGLLRAGCNVRVSNPWLPADFPESWGMDWSGRDLPSWTKAQEEKAAKADRVAL